MTRSASQKSVTSLDSLIAGLGWFSIGLGLAELITPRQVSNAAGMHTQDGLLRGYGLREIATGVGILLSPNPRPWLWGRVAGDVLDVATLATRADTQKQGRLGASAIALFGVGILDLYAAIQSVPKRSRLFSSGKDYSDRSGFRRPIEHMRGAVLRQAGSRAQSAAPANSAHA
jgi:hypothetical protein